MIGWVQVCGRCNREVYDAGQYEATHGYAMSAGCRRCNPDLRTDRERLVAALEALEGAVVEGKQKIDKIRRP